MPLYLNYFRPKLIIFSQCNVFHDSHDGLFICFFFTHDSVGHALHVPFLPIQIYVFSSSSLISQQNFYNPINAPFA